MNCPVCNEKLKDPNQKFCHNCGTSMEDIKEQSINQPSTQYTQQVSIPKSQIEKSDQLDKHSRKSFIFGVISLASFVVSFVLGLSIFIMFLTSFDRLFGISSSWVINLIIKIIIINLHILGMILGIVGKGQSKETSSSHVLRTIGNIFSIIGIVLNSIGLTTSIIGLLIFPIGF